MHGWQTVAFLMGTEDLYIRSWPSWQSAMQAQLIETQKFNFNSGTDKTPEIRDAIQRFRVMALM